MTAARPVDSMVDSKVEEKALMLDGEKVDSLVEMMVVLWVALMVGLRFALLV